MTDASDQLAGVPEHREHRIPTADGRTLAVAEWGDPKGLPLVAIHGTPGSRISWWQDPTIYARHGLRRLTVDRPGYGESTRQAGRCVADFASDVATIADALGLAQFAVTGGSGGGPHALACAALLPDRVVRCLAAVSIAPFGDDGLPKDEWLAGMTQGNIIEFEAALAGESAYRPVCEAERLTILARLADGRAEFLGDSYEMSEADVAQMIKHQARGAAHMSEALRPGADGWIDDGLAFVRPWGFDVSSIRVPTLVHYGRADTLVPEAHGDWLVAHIPGAVAEVTDAGHMGDDADVERHMAWLAGEPA